MALDVAVRILLAALVTTVVGLLAPAQALGSPARAAHQRCVAVEATGVGQDLGDGRTTATVTAAGVTVGTTAATFTITGIDGTVASFVGPIVFTGPGGTLIADVTGTLETSTGDFTATSTALTGTGGLAGVTGQLTFSGHEDLSTGAFTETISGALCASPPGRRG